MDEFLARDPVLPSDSSPACPRYNEAQEKNVRDIKEHLEQRWVSDGFVHAFAGGQDHRNQRVHACGMGQRERENAPTGSLSNLATGRRFNLPFSYSAPGMLHAPSTQCQCVEQILNVRFHADVLLFNDSAISLRHIRRATRHGFHYFTARSKCDKSVVCWLRSDRSEETNWLLCCW